MAGALGDPKLEELIDEVDRSLATVAEHGIEPVDADHAMRVVRRVEASARRLHALQVQLVAEIDRRHLHRADGHRSARATASRCQADHLEPWSQGGRTDPGNGAPTCGKHNRFRNHGFTVERDASGRLHVYRPDGTEIT